MSTTQDTPFAARVRLELRLARRKHATPIHSLHEGYAVLLEELAEFWEEVCKQDDDRVPALMLGELVQVAAMCQRVAEDCALMGSHDETRGDGQE